MAVHDGGERGIERHGSTDRDLAVSRFTIREENGSHRATRFTVMVDNADVLFAHCDFLNCDSQMGLWSLATSFNPILSESMSLRCDADDGMSGKTLPVEKAEVMDSSAADADIDAEAAVRIVDGIGYFGAIEFSTLTAKDVLTTEFTSLQGAYDYYNEYDRIKGISVRRSKVGHRTKQGAEGEIIWQIFVCSREGERDGKHMQREDRKMDPQPITRCGCEARIKVHVDDAIRRWFVEQLCDNHNHPMLDARFKGLSRSHRAVKEGDLHQINSMRKSGLRVPTIFRAFANQSGGFETVGFEIKDIYNAIEKQRRVGAIDAEVTLKFLGISRTTDFGIYFLAEIEGPEQKSDSEAEKGLQMLLDSDLPALEVDFLELQKSKCLYHEGSNVTNLNALLSGEVIQIRGSETKENILQLSSNDYVEHHVDRFVVVKHVDLG
ncbi:Protein FAR1-RELATED SEQUENCE [Arachis hypogaea]|nr:Protein FAR1-RELATED SEQUENCE [Arachis hypogaea]